MPVIRPSVPPTTRTAARRRPRLVLLALVGLLVGGVLAAAPAQAAAYSVTLQLSRATVDVGQTIKLTGKVSGKGSAKKTLSVWRRTGTAESWTKIGTVRTTSKSAYSYTFKATRTGAQQLRVVAPKVGTTTIGVSPSRSFTGWRWLNLAQQPLYTRGEVFVGRAPTLNDDSVYPHSIEMFAAGSGRPLTSVFWSLGNQCDASDVDVAVYDGADDQVVDLETDDGADSFVAEDYSLTGANRVTVQSEFLRLTRRSATGNAVVVASPRVHCKVSRLPEPSF